jgi:hypothetical protein
MKTEQYFSTTYRFTVLGRGLKGELSIEAVYDRLVLKMKSPTGNYSYDSALNEDLSSPLAALRGLVGGRLTFALGSDLRIGEIGGLPELSARIAAAARNPALAVVAAATMGEAPIRRSLESIFGLFPKGHVAAGDSWAMEASPTEGSSGSGALAASRCKITAVKVNGDRFSAKVEAIPAGPAGGEASMLCGALSGHVELDSARLRVLSGAMKMDIDGSVIVRGTKIPTKIKSAMHFE